MASGSNSSGLPNDSDTESSEEPPLVIDDNDMGAGASSLSSFDGTFDSTFAASSPPDAGSESLESMPVVPSSEASASSWQPPKSVEELKSQLTEVIGSAIESGTSRSSPRTDRTDTSYMEKQSPQAALELEQATDRFRAELDAASSQPVESFQHEIEGAGGLKLGGARESAAAASSSVEPRDAFILFNEAESEVEAIVESLQKLGVTVYFWRKDVAFGEQWKAREDAELQACRCVLLFLGEKGWGPNHQRIAREAVQLKKSIFPVLLARMPDAALAEVDSSFLNLRRAELVPPTKDKIRELAKEIRDLRPNSTSNAFGSQVAKGKLSSFTRDAPASAALLHADKYADVVANLIRSIGNDESLSFAILAPWGRGKTYLMQLIGDQLKQHSYEVVTFSAWKYRTAPEVWAYLYETLHCRACKSNWRVPIRTGLLRRGLWPLVVTLLMLSVTLATFAQKAEVISSAISMFGFVGVLYLVGMSSKLYHAGKTLTTYLQMPRHHERLGLQFAIGADLKSLLQGWIPDKRNFWPAVRCVFSWSGIASLAYVLAAASVCFTLQQVIPALATKNFNASMVVVVALGVVICIAAVPAFVFVERESSKKRILLVVDDLDRCPAEQMLDIIECLQLFLDDEAVKKRLKLVFLVEESILRNALLRKYVSALQMPEDNPAAVHQLVTDNLEKLFLCWLRLESLRSDELKKIFKGICDSLGPPASQKNVPVNSGEGERDQSDINSNVGDPSGNDARLLSASALKPKAESAKTPDAKRTDVEFTLSEDEKQAITSLVDDVQFEAGRDSWGPRAARCFVFRYQLARMLLNALDRKFEPHELVSALAVASDRERREPNRSVDPFLFQIAKQVS